MEVSSGVMQDALVFEAIKCSFCCCVSLQSISMMLFALGQSLCLRQDGREPSMRFHKHEATSSQASRKIAALGDQIDKDPFETVRLQCLNLCY